ncbi:hypothetical protein [Vulgatibacter sp.]|uniref:hypothetical protein n=1 Tax=Vulgatibacter sp. TaxID=1971226 RepID=UPI003564A602
MEKADRSVVLRLEQIFTLEDDGTEKECACCALVEGRTPKSRLGEPLSDRIFEIAYPILEVVGQGPYRAWLLLFLCAARGWNLAVEGDPAGSPGWLRATAVRITVIGTDQEIDAGPLILAMAERKRRVYPKDRRIVESLSFTEDGRLWCKPAA